MTGEIIVHGQLQPARVGHCFLQKEWFGTQVTSQVPSNSPTCIQWNRGMHSMGKKGK